MDPSTAQQDIVLPVYLNLRFCIQNIFLVPNRMIKRSLYFWQFTLNLLSDAAA